MVTVDAGYDLFTCISSCFIVLIIIDNQFICRIIEVICVAVNSPLLPLLC